MKKKMLEAVSEMLDLEGSEDTKIFKHQVKCAKVVLDKVIESFDENIELKSLLDNQPSVHLKTVSKPEVLPEPKLKLKRPDGKYKVVKSDTNKLIEIDGLPLDAKVEIDGKVMTHHEAKGKTFNRGKIL